MSKIIRSSLSLRASAGQAVCIAFVAAASFSTASADPCPCTYEDHRVTITDPDDAIDGDPICDLDGSFLTIHIVANGTSSVPLITIDVDDDGSSQPRSIFALTVEANETSSLVDEAVAIRLRGAYTGALQHVRNIQATSADMVDNCEFWITELIADGNLGFLDGSSQPDGLIEANRFGDIVTNADCLAELSVLDTVLDTESVSVGIEVAGDLLNDVFIAGGEVGPIDVDGDIGTPASPITIEGEGQLERIQADAIYADIDLGTGLTSSGGRLNRLITRDGPFIGDLTCLGLDIAGDGVTGLVDIETDLDGTIASFEPLNQNSAIYIGNDFLGDSIISLPNEGLEGQIIINQNDDGGEWLGDVILRKVSPSSITDADITLSGPGYTDLIEDLGGGAADEAPFLLHQESSEPPMDGTTPGTIFVSTMDFLSVPPSCEPIDPDAFLQFYGAIFEDDIGGQSIVIQRRVDTSTWMTVTSDFTIDVISDGSADRRLLISSDVDWYYSGSYAHEYRVSRATNDKLVCDVVDETPAVQDFDNGADNYFYFNTADGCGLMMLSHFDQNDDRDLTSADISAWLANPRDLDGDLDSDSDDLYRLTVAIAAYDSYRD